MYPSSAKFPVRYVSHSLTYVCHFSTYVCHFSTYHVREKFHKQIHASEQVTPAYWFQESPFFKVSRTWNGEWEE